MIRFIAIKPPIKAAQRGARAFEAFTSVLQTIRKTNPKAMVAALTKLISPAAPA